MQRPPIASWIAGPPSQPTQPVPAHQPDHHVASGSWTMLSPRQAASWNAQEDGPPSQPPQPINNHTAASWTSNPVVPAQEMRQVHGVAPQRSKSVGWSQQPQLTFKNQLTPSSSNKSPSTSPANHECLAPCRKAQRPETSNQHITEPRNPPVSRMPAFERPSSSAIPQSFIQPIQGHVYHTPAKIWTPELPKITVPEGLLQPVTAVKQEPELDVESRLRRMKEDIARVRTVFEGAAERAQGAWIYAMGVNNQAEASMILGQLTETKKKLIDLDHANEQVPRLMDYKEYVETLDD